MIDERAKAIRDEAPKVGELLWLIKRSERAVYQALSQALRPFALTPSQFGALLRLSDMGGASSAELARAAFVTPQAMKGMVDSLESKGYLTRVPVPRSRVIETSMTAEGREVLKAACERTAAVEAELATLLGADLLDMVKDALARVIAVG